MAAGDRVPPLEPCVNQAHRTSCVKAFLEWDCAVTAQFNLGGTVEYLIASSHDLCGMGLFYLVEKFVILCSEKGKGEISNESDLER